MKKSVKILIIVIGILVVVGVGILLIYLNQVNRYKKEVASMTITDINLSELPDGTYTGDCDVDFVYAKVEVTVKDRIITDINLLKHKTGSGHGKPAEAIIDNIIKAQSLDVDTVSGATNSSKVIKKAIENALLKGAAQNE